MTTKTFFVNAKWLYWEKGFNFLNSAFVIVLLTSHLGIELFGTYSYIIGFVTLFSFLSFFGLDAILVRDFKNDDYEDSVLIGSSVFLLSAASFSSFLISCITAYFLIESERVFYLTVIMSLSFISSPLTVFYMYFNAKMDLVLLSASRILGLIGIFIIKLIALWLGWDLIGFVFIEMISIAFLALQSLFVFLVKIGKPQLRICWITVKRLALDGLPLMISSGAIVAYAKIDIIILGYLLDFREVGIYSAAVKISEIWYVIPMTLTTLLFPLILGSRKESPMSYRKMLRSASETMLIVCFLAVTLLFAFGPYLVKLVYQPEFHVAGEIIRILSFTGIFVGLGYVNGRYLVAENLLYLTMRRNLYGLALNVTLNFVLIPLYGIHGAAISTLIAIFYTGLGCLVFSKKTHDIFRIQCLAFNILAQPLRVINNLKALGGRSD